MRASLETAQKPLYRERVLPSISTFLATVLAFPMVALVFLPIVGLTPSLIIAGLVFAALDLTLVSASAVISVSVIDGIATLQVGRARIPAKHLGEIRVLESGDLRLERGPGLNARAFVYFQAGVTGTIKIEIKDRYDPTPYWLVSTRKPERLRDVLKGLSKR